MTIETWGGIKFHYKGKINLLYDGDLLYIDAVSDLLSEDDFIWNQQVYDTFFISDIKYILI